MCATMPGRHMTEKNRKRRGFNLVEAAIVLGVVGLVIGGIWVAAAAVQSNLRKSDASKGLIQIVQNVRNLYYGQAGPNSEVDVTTQLIQANVIPGDFIRGTTAVNPWNGYVSVTLDSSSMAVQYDAVPRDACIELSSRNTNISTGIGLTQMAIGSTLVTTFPYLPTDAAAACAATNTVMWRFGLRG